MSIYGRACQEILRCADSPTVDIVVLSTEQCRTLVPALIDACYKPPIESPTQVELTMQDVLHEAGETKERAALIVARMAQAVAAYSQLLAAVKSVRNGPYFEGPAAIDSILRQHHEIPDPRPAIDAERMAKELHYAMQTIIGQGMTPGQRVVKERVPWEDEKPAARRSLVSACYMVIGELWHRSAPLFRARLSEGLEDASDLCDARPPSPRRPVRDESDVVGDRSGGRHR